MPTKKWIEENKEKINEYRREWYQKNKESEQKRLEKTNKKRKKEIQDWYRKKKEDSTCEKCGENHPACLDFHHNDPSEKIVEVSLAVERGWNIKKIEEEMSKCKVLCSNCHRKLHWEQKQKYRS